MQKRRIDDSEMAGLFKTMQQTDREQAPAFDQVWQAAKHAQERKRRAMWFRFAAAAVVLIAISASYYALTDRRPSSPVPVISEWQSPTHSLLRVSGPAVLPPSSVSGWRSPTDGLLDETQDKEINAEAQNPAPVNPEEI